MKMLKILRLLLDVYGAAFLLVIIIAPLIYGVFPYEGLLRLGSLAFYILIAVAFAVWIWLAGRVLITPAPPPAPPPAAPRGTGAP